MTFTLCMASTFSCMHPHDIYFTLAHDPIICKVWPILWSTNSTIAHLICPFCIQPHSSNPVAVLLPVSSLIPSSSGSDLIASSIWLLVADCWLHPVAGCQPNQLPVASFITDFHPVASFVQSSAPPGCRLLAPFNLRLPVLPVFEFRFLSHICPCKQIGTSPTIPFVLSTHNEN